MTSMVSSEVTAVIVENALSHSKQARANGRDWMWLVSFFWLGMWKETSYKQYWLVD
jgi:hypothetical protein